MEITNEIKAKMFAQYLGCRIRPNPKYTIPEYYKQYLDKTGTYECKGSLITTGANRDLLVLKPLTSITDEDAKEVACIDKWDKIWEEDGYMDKEAMEASLIQKGYEMVTDYLFQLPYKGYQFLQSKGYDIPQYLLGGKTLKEAGIAIYKEDLK